jgi:CubicO group peptidase (beta-lactamase class C family)
MQAFVDSNRLAGIAMAVARHGKVAYYDAVGTMDSARTMPMKTDAVFRIYSMTKPLTTVAIMQLHERGKLKLDDPVSKYIPEFANQQVYASGPAASPTVVPAARATTIGDLLTHTGGLTYGAFSNTPVDSMYRAANVLGENEPVAKVAADIGKIPLLYQPGTRWVYSMSLDVLGRVVEVASGKTFDRYLAEEVFAPLGMEHTAFHATPAMTGNITWVFQAAGARGIRAAGQLLGAGYRDGDKPFMGGMGLLSTIPDYMRFCQALLNRGELDGKRILKKETVALMMQNHLPDMVRNIPGSRSTGFGYGGSVKIDTSSSSPTAAGTFAWAGYASTYFWIDPKNDLIGMVWAQLTPQFNPLEPPFQRIVYSAIRPN